MTVVRYAESGSTWWPVLWGPAFCAVGAGAEALSGPVHGWAWVGTAALLAALAAPWVAARRRVYAVELTDEALTLGGHALPAARIARPHPDPEATGPVLGGGFAVPSKTGAVPLELVDGTVVLAWARDPDALREALAGPVPAAVDPEEPA